MKKGILMLLTLISLVCVLCSCGECTDHVYGEWSVKTAATCTQAGVKERVCTNCEYVETGVIPTTAHSYTKEEVLAEDANLASAATCTTKATYYKLCAACNAASATETFESGEVAAHSYTKEEILAEDANLASAATCTAKATYYKLCAVCNAASTADTFESGELAAHSYTKEEVLAEDANLASAATCTAKATYYKLCAGCDAASTADTFEYGDVVAHVYTKEAVLADDANIVSAATCLAKAVYYKVCEVCDAFDATEEAATFEYGEVAAHAYAKEFIDGDLLWICGVCNDYTLLAQSPSVSQNSFSVDVTDFDGIFTVPAEKVTVSGFYFVTLEGTTKITSGYKGLYNTIGAVGILGFEGDIDEIAEMSKLLASQNRDKADGYLYSVYLVAGIDNVISYVGETVTKANFTLAEPYVDGSIVVGGGKANTTVLNPVENAVYKEYKDYPLNNVFYQLRPGSVLQYNSKITVANAGFYSIGAVAYSNEDLGVLTFTFVDANGESYTASLDCAVIRAALGNPELLNGGSEAAAFAPDLTFVYLPAGEYTMTVSLAEKSAVMIGAVMMTPMTHECQPSVSFDKDATCTEKGYTGEGCPVCFKGVTVIPALGHNYGEGVTTNATCEADGSIVHTCANCGDLKTETIPALGHAWDDGVTTDATCTVDGSTVYTCANCGGTKTDVITASHAWGEWIVNEAGNAQTRTCDKCGETETEKIEAPDGKLIVPTFTTVDNMSWTITVPANQIVMPGIYSLYFKTEGDWVKAYGCLTTSGAFTMANRFKDTSVDADGYSTWSFQTYLEPGDEDVMLTLSFKSAQGGISEMKLVLLAEVVGYTTVNTAGQTGNVTMNGTITGVAAGDYKLATFANCFGTGVLTVNVADATNSKTYAVSAKENALPTEGVDGTLVYTYSSANYDGSTGTAHYIEIGDVTCDGTDIAVTYTATVAEQGNKIESASTVAGGAAAGVYPVFIVIPVTAE